ncbi:MAG: clan AA aspartic protease [Betaproteobacteria bacterium]|nr:clan AA aspartic protease [Betaproteobacteria bacterium]
MNFPKGHMAALLIWLALSAAAYTYFDARQKPTVATARERGRGEVVIPRSRDGHYYVQGAINAQPVTFLVDTGASSVSVGVATARAAGLPQGAVAHFQTAGGDVPGEMVTGATVEAGGIEVRGLSVGVIPALDGEVPALLGQNFLRRVEVVQSGDRMVLRVRPSGGS